MEPKLARKLHQLMADPLWGDYEDYMNERAANVFARFINENDPYQLKTLQGEAKVYYAMLALKETIRQSLENE